MRRGLLVQSTSSVGKTVVFLTFSVEITRLAGRRATELKPSTLEQTERTFGALLANERAASVAAADEAIWAYLAPVQGLDAQTEALDALSKAVARLNASTPFMPVLMDTIDRHWQRLASSSA